MRAGLLDSVADAIQGHAGRSDGDGYRHGDVRTMAAVLARILIPRRHEPARAREEGQTQRG